jgi:hypothetical protein
VLMFSNRSSRQNTLLDAFLRAQVAALRFIDGEASQKMPAETVRGPKPDGELTLADVALSAAAPRACPDLALVDFTARLP